MNPEFLTLIGLPYNFHKGPQAAENLDSLSELNCQGLVHAFYKKMGLKLSPEMRSKEIFEDERIFFRTLRQEALKIGDVHIFGRKEEKDSRRLHLAVFTGDYDTNGSPFLLHATKIDGTVCIWPLSKFSTYPSYSRLYAVKRLISL